VKADTLYEVVMNIIFFGTSSFAVPSLEKLILSRHRVNACVTQPDRKRGRALKTGSSPVKDIAQAHGIPILQPEVMDNGFVEAIKKYDSDIFIVIAYGHILKENILEIPKYYSVNLHSSLLPCYRGAAPINWAIINGDGVTGISIIRMDETMDGGDIIARYKTEIMRNETSVTLGERLSRCGADLLLETMDLIEGESAAFEKQDSAKVTYARKLTKEDGLIDWTSKAIDIHNRVRGMAPWPGAYTSVGGKKLTVWKTCILEGEGEAGVIIEATDNSMIVGTAGGLLKVEQIQIEGKRKMPISEFLRGYRNIKKGDILGE